MLRGRLVSSGTAVDRGWVVVVGDRIAAVGSGPAPPAGWTLDVGSMVVAPGFVDLHVHGAGGRQVAGRSAGEVAAAVGVLARWHARHGTTALLPTTVSDTPAALLTAVEGVASAMAGLPAAGPGSAGGPGSVAGLAAGRGSADGGRSAVEAGSGGGSGRGKGVGGLEPDAAPPAGPPSAPDRGATVLGTHLEGPWLAPGRAGAHAPDQLRLPDLGELERLVEASGGTIRIVTLAPELAGSGELITAGRMAGITMSVGHTDADYDAVRRAFALGARHVTHVGNAMPFLDRRRPGPIAAAVADSQATLEVIADGIHVHPGFLAFLAAAAGDRLVAVTDATSATGMPPGSYRLGALDVVVADGRVVLAEDPQTLAGSVLSMDRAVATLVASGVDLATAVRSATATPAAAIGAVGKGHLVPGADADLVILDHHLEARATVIAGRVVWDPDGLFRRGSPDPGGRFGAAHP